MDVAVRNGLPSVLSNVDANIKSSNCSVALLDQEPLRLHKLVTRINFSLAQIKIVRCVPLRDNQPMSFGDWKSIQIHVGEFVLLNNPVRNWFAEDTANFSQGIGGTNSSEIGIVSIPLHCVAGVAQSLEVAEIV